MEERVYLCIVEYTASLAHETFVSKCSSILNIADFNHWLVSKKLCRSILELHIDGYDHFGLDFLIFFDILASMALFWPSFGRAQWLTLMMLIS